MKQYTGSFPVIKVRRGENTEKRRESGERGRWRVGKEQKAMEPVGIYLIFHSFRDEGRIKERGQKQRKEESVRAGKAERKGEATRSSFDFFLIKRRRYGEEREKLEKTENVKGQSEGTKKIKRRILFLPL